MYCPVCYNNSIVVADKGVINVIINNRQMDAGRFLFNNKRGGKDSQEELLKSFTAKVEEYFQWYSTFKNAQTIQKIILSSNNLICSNNCKIPTSMRYDVTTMIFTEQEIKQVLTKLGKKYGIQIDLNDFS